MQEKSRFRKRTILASILILIVIPLTILAGVFYMDDRKYYVISMAILAYSFLPFILVFENRKPQARELIVIAVLSAIAVAGRGAFFMIPQFKPVVAIVIVSGVCFGAESGFFVGAMSGFVSNFFFGQGPWTPWQMFCFGVIGFLAGIMFQRGLLKKNVVPLCIFGGISTFFIYGGIINIWSLLMFTSEITKASVIAIYTSAIPFDMIHAASTVVFLALIANPMIEKLDRIKVKYGLIE
ncbi:MAG: ECF transporter S component [Clostridioides sp.]|nr:ECF transporter S component [Clostridioides sp.]